MANIFKKLKRGWRDFVVANLPPELAQCEDGCRVSECTQGAWLTCKNRLRRMREEVRAAEGLGKISSSADG